MRKKRKIQRAILAMFLLIAMVALPQKVTAAELKENPIKSFKLGTTDFSSAFSAKKFKDEFGMVIANQQTLKLKKKQNKIKVNVKMKKGYTLKKFQKPLLKKLKIRK